MIVATLVFTEISMALYVPSFRKSETHQPLTTLPIPHSLSHTQVFTHTLMHRHYSHTRIYKLTHSHTSRYILMVVYMEWSVKGSMTFCRVVRKLKQLSASIPIHTLPFLPLFPSHRFLLLLPSPFLSTFIFLPL